MRTNTHRRRSPRLETLESRDAPTVAPVGSEFRVNTYTAGSGFRDNPSMASDSAGNFVVTWLSYLQDGSGEGVYAQRLNASGAPIGGEFQVNTYTTGDQEYPTVAMDAAGDFVITWHSSGGQDGDGRGVFARRYDSAGNALGAEFQVNTYTTYDQLFPTVAMDSDGDFVVAWQDNNSNPTGGVWARRFNSAGAAQGSAFRVPVSTSGAFVQLNPAAAMDAAGNFVIVWDSFGQDGDLNGIYARRYDATGSPLTSEFPVNIYTTSRQERPAVAMNASGDFVVSWESLGQDGSDYGIYARRYNAAAVPQTGEIPVNTFTTQRQFLSATAMNAAGEFLVTWGNNPGTGAPLYEDVEGRTFDATGAPQGGEFQVNTSTSGYQTDSAAVATPTGFVVAWYSTAGGNVFAQRYKVLPPKVTSVQVNDGSAQRSRVTSLTVTFDQTVTLPANAADAFQLKRQSDSALVALAASVNGNVVTLTFTGGAVDGASLADGRYTLTALASQINGTNFDGNGDGTPGDDYVLIGNPATNKLFRLYGDADGNGLVDGVDFGAFRSAFNTNSFTFDFDGSGVVDGLDFGQFRQRFGVVI